MGQWLTKITDVIRPFLAKNGGPIILMQIENEYTGGSHDYAQWCGDFASSLDLDIPITMCREMAYNFTLNTADGSQAFEYAQANRGNFPNQPSIWTENESGNQDWNSYYNPNEYNGNDNRSPYDFTNSVALWVAAGGAYYNTYTHYGGNHIKNHVHIQYINILSEKRS